MSMTKQFDILLINVYFPYHNTRDIITYMSLYRDTIGYVENIIAQNSSCKVMILADINCDIYDDSHPYTSMIRDLMERHNLQSAFDMVDNFDYQSSFTRFDLKTNAYSLIDGILNSSSLREYISNVQILTRGDNVSDHCPVQLDIDVQISETTFEKTSIPQYVNWKKLTSHDLQSFHNTMATNLASIEVPFHAVLHGDKCCLDDS